MNLKEKLLNKKKQLLSLDDKRGFTLIELIVVMAIMAILVLIAAPMFLNYTKDAAVTQMEQDARVIHDAAMQYHIDNEEWPADIDAGRIPVVYYDDDSSEGENYDYNVYPIIDGALDEYINSTSNPIADYGIIYDNSDKDGVILYTGKSNPDNDPYVEDRDGVWRVGINKATLDGSPSPED